MKPKWLIETSILKDTNAEALPSVVKQQGYSVFEIEYNLKNRKIEKIPYINSECVIVYGSYNFLNELKKLGYRFIPGAYGISNNNLCSNYLHHIPQNLLANNDYIYLTWGELKRRKEFLKTIFNSNGVFIRPNSGFKTFSGFCLYYNEWDYEINARQQTTSVIDETVVLISSLKNIIEEYRFVAVNRQIVTGSRYHVNGDLSESVIIDNRCFEIAKEIIKIDWQLDTCYTVDVGLLRNINTTQPKIIELNSFGCAGLYMCDLTKIVQEVSKLAEQEYFGLV